MNDTIETRILVYSKIKNEFRPVKIYRDSQGRKWIEAKHNSEFQIEINPISSYSTFLAVVSVDGLNVITGQEAEQKPEGGYILNPYQKLRINGWRTSLNEVRKFVFTCNRKETYTSKLNNDTSNNGVIGVCLFSEKVQPTIHHVMYNQFGNPEGTRWLRSTNDPYSKGFDTNVTCSCVNDASMSMGTKQGQEIYDHVVEVEKEFHDYISFSDTIYYDSRENLITKGIIKENQEDELPKPFKTSRFCPSL